MKSKQIPVLIAICFTSAFAGNFVSNRFFESVQSSTVKDNKSLAVYYAKYSNEYDTAIRMDFTKASAISVPAVVHIKTKNPLKRSNANDDFLSQLLGVPEQRASGSGVIVSEDGYIVTNNHVISNDKGEMVNEINVTVHNGKTYPAKVIGRSETADIAVLKIDAQQLSYMIFGNSDLLQTGQWVLAVGYPFSLEATVTAGIVSATGRNIGFGRQVKNDKAPQKTFIQTDAAVNSGNSGGALINTNGELIGINSGIMSPTGTYAGYSFAVPVNIVKNAVKEIIQSGGFR
jgi:S1-C subfamily serine protease